MLKKSGYFKNIENGIELGYTTPYAAKVEFGSEGTPYTGTQIVNVKPHSRRSALSGTVIDVPAHIRKYTDKRLVGFKSENGELIFRVLKQSGGQRGQHFLGRAVSQGIKSLPEDIKFFLSRI